MQVCGKATDWILPIPSGKMCPWQMRTGSGSVTTWWRGAPRSACVTARTLGKLENGKRVSASTLGAVENQLGWAPGSCRRILAGGEPTTVAGGASPSRYSDPTLQHIAETPGLPPDVVRGLIALARNWRDEADQAEGADDLLQDEDERQRPERRGA